MTHEELLAKFPLGSFYTNDQLNGMLRSIRAVVELCKPNEDDTYKMISSLEILQAIEKELG